MREVYFEPSRLKCVHLNHECMSQNGVCTIASTSQPPSSQPSDGNPYVPTKSSSFFFSYSVFDICIDV